MKEQMMDMTGQIEDMQRRFEAQQKAQAKKFFLRQQLLHRHICTVHVPLRCGTRCADVCQCKDLLVLV